MSEEFSRVALCLPIRHLRKFRYPEVDRSFFSRPARLLLASSRHFLSIAVRRSTVVTHPVRIDRPQAAQLRSRTCVVRPSARDGRFLCPLRFSLAAHGLNVLGHLVPVDEASPLQPAVCSHFDLQVPRVRYCRVVKVIHPVFASCVR